MAVAQEQFIAPFIAAANIHLAGNGHGYSEMPDKKTRRRLHFEVTRLTRCTSAGGRRATAVTRKRAELARGAA